MDGPGIELARSGLFSAKNRTRWAATASETSVILIARRVSAVICTSQRTAS